MSFDPKTDENVACESLTHGTGNSWRFNPKKTLGKGLTTDRHNFNGFTAIKIKYRDLDFNDVDIRC